MSPERQVRLETSPKTSTLQSMVFKTWTWDQPTGPSLCGHSKMSDVQEQSPEEEAHQQNIQVSTHNPN